MVGRVFAWVFAACALFLIGVDSNIAEAAGKVDYREVAFAEAQRAGIRDPALFVRQIAAESGYNPRAKSYVGARGIAQIMPATAREWKVNPMKPRKALRAAATNMAAYERRYGNFKLALAAYNAGPGAVARYGGVPPYRETRDYVRKITRRSTPLPGLGRKDVELVRQERARKARARAAAQRRAARRKSRAAARAKERVREARVNARIEQVRRLHFRV